MSTLRRDKVALQTSVNDTDTIFESKNAVTGHVMLSANDLHVVLLAEAHSLKALWLILLRIRRPALV